MDDLLLSVGGGYYVYMHIHIKDDMERAKRVNHMLVVGHMKVKVRVGVHLYHICNQQHINIY